MQFIFNGDNNLYGYGQDNEDFVFPANIKQMGSVDPEIKIYMEDYVHTYLYQYAKTNGGKEKLAALVGKYTMAEGEEVIVISGAIQGKDTVKQAGIETFSDESWSYINKQMDVYFKGLSIVGWMHSQPGFGAFLMSKDAEYHREYFQHSWQVLYSMDPLDHSDAFFIHNKEKTGLREAKGYFIYYSKNETMQEYMLDNSVVKPKAQAGMVQMEEMEEKEEREERKERIPVDRIDAAGRIRRVLKDKQEEEDRRTRQRYTALASISGVLCIVCFLMGAGLIRNLDRIKRLESEVVTVKTSYDAIAEQLQNVTYAAYAAQSQVVPASVQANAPVEAEPENAEPVKTEEPVKEETTQIEITEEPKEEQEEPKEEPAQETAADGIPEFYIVEEGDSLGYISKKFYGTTAKANEIMVYNDIKDADKIFIGKKIYLP